MSHVHTALVLGAGFGGLAAAIRLREAGHTDVVVLEKASSPGGTWRENTYPGCACDVQSHLYSLSFAPKSDWTKRYAAWHEIRDHIERDVVDRFALREVIRFGHEVVGAAWDEATGTWTVDTAHGVTLRARFLIVASGPLHHPAMPEIPGLQRFRGPVFHSARWDHTVPLEGRVVASIGTGASAVQYVPEIAPRVGRLHVFQRSPAWVLPRDDRPYSRLSKWAFRTVPGWRRLHRARLYVRNEARMLPLGHAWLAQALQRLAVLNLRRQVHNPELARRLTPTETIGCKRALLSNVYYPAFNRENVELVTERIVEVTEDAVVTADGQVRKVDVIVCGTGFVVDPRRYLDRMRLRGVAGVELRDTWRSGARALYGVSVPGFPNLFHLVGPNTGLGHNSILLMIEAQVTHVLALLREASARGADVIEARPEALERFDVRVQGALRGTVWASGCTSWYQQEDGRNFSIWPFSTWRYALETRRIAPDDFLWRGGQRTSR